MWCDAMSDKTLKTKTENNMEILNTKTLSTEVSSMKDFIKKYAVNEYLKLKSKKFRIYEFSFFLSGIYLPSKWSKSDLLNAPITTDIIIWIIASFVIANSLIGIVVSFAKWLKVVYAK